MIDMRNRWLVLAAPLLACAALASPAQATSSISGAVYEIDGPTFSSDHPGSFSGPGGSASIAALPAVVLRASSSNSAGASALMTYHFSVTGHDCSCFVPISITGSLSGDSTPDPVHGLNAGFYAELRVDATDEARKYVSTFDGLVSFSDNWSGTLLVHAVPDGRLHSVYILVRAEGVSAHAYADPVITIDPSFALTDPNYLTNYSLELSPGVGNALPTGGVPEPAGWAMLLGGFGLLGTAMRRRRTAVIAA